jgi:hypothetical protein
MLKIFGVLTGHFVSSLEKWLFKSFAYFDLAVFLPVL